jgi:UDP-glucuronate 4-epimerase
MNFLVTGGAGFIGSHVSKALLDIGHNVVVVDNLNDFYDPAIKICNVSKLEETGKGRFKFERIDITDRNSVDSVFEVNEFDQVIHLAARAGVRPSIEEPALYQRVNVEGTVNLLEAGRKNGVKKWTIASSSSVYGVNSKVPFSEVDPIFTPISPYAASKLACEALAHAYHHIYKLDIVVPRFFTVYGPGQRPDLAIHKFTKLIREGKEIPFFGDGSTRRDYTYIDDIVSGVISCTTKFFGYEVINLGGNQTTTLNELVDTIAKKLNKPAIKKYLPQQPGDVPCTYANIQKAKSLLNYDALTPIDDGIGKFIEWFNGEFAQE